jgi:hypothetical protein
MQKCTMYFFNATYQAKAIAMGISRADPLAQLIDSNPCLHSYMHPHLNSQKLETKVFSQYPHLYLSILLDFLALSPNARGTQINMST